MARESVRVYVALGSNLGEREAHLRRAVESIASLPGTSLVRATDPEETAAIGPAQPAYLNQMLLIETTLDPHALLDALQQVEHEGGRVREERWGPRTIDCDIVLYDDAALSDDRLTVPHPELANRDFWLRELAALAPAP